MAVHIRFKLILFLIVMLIIGTGCAIASESTSEVIEKESAYEEVIPNYLYKIEDRKKRSDVQFVEDYKVFLEENEHLDIISVVLERTEASSHSVNDHYKIFTKPKQ